MFFKEFQGLLVTKNFTVWRIKDSVPDFYDVNIPKKMIHHTYFFLWNEYYFVVTIAIANGKLNATEIIEYPKTDMNRLFCLSDIPQQSQQEYSKLVYLKSW